MNINLEAAVKRLMVHGPDRVVVNVDQEAVSPRRAREEHGINPDVVFIRRDGWMLGAPARFAAAAFGAWSDHWIGFVKRPETVARPMSEYPLG
jgi:hypothetical protein